MTKRQKSIIMDIEFKLGIVYETPEAGLASFATASRFIAKHIDELRKYNRSINFDPPPTGKQDRYINVIEKELHVKFMGTTITEASEFIAMNYKNYQLVKRGVYI
jgi:hypothetical protein